MKLSEKADKIQKILDDKFSQLKMSSPFCDRGQPWVFVCYWELGSNIAIDLTAEEITESLIRGRILNMLWDAKRVIECDIEKLEKENDQSTIKTNL